MPAAEQSEAVNIEMTVEIKLTAGEQTALMDRLELADNIAEVLGCEEELWKPFQYQSAAIEERCRILGRLIGGEARAIPPIATDLDKAILVECIEGSTYIAQASDEPQLQGARRRVMRSLVAKMIAAGIADEIDIPSA